MAGISFTTLGSRPGSTPGLQPFGTPGNLKPNVSGGGQTFGQYSPVAPLASSGPIKSHTVTNPDGSTVAQTYHQPANTGMVPQSGTSTNTPAPTNTQPGMIPGAQPGTVGQAYNSLQGIQNKELALQPAEAQSSTPLAQSNIGQGAANLISYNQSAINNQLQPLEAAQQNATTQGQLAQPQGFSYQQNVINPATQGQLGNAAQGQGSTAASGGAATQQYQQGSDVQSMKGIQSQAQGLSGQLAQQINTAGINPLNPNNASILTSFANGVNQWLNTGAGNPQYQNFSNLIGEVASKYASILNQAGGTPTDQSQISHQIINGMAGGQSIEQVLQSLDKNASDSINSLNSVAQGGTPNDTSNSGSPSTSSFNW